jgi:hypothetical protein
MLKDVKILYALNVFMVLVVCGLALAFVTQHTKTIHAINTSSRATAYVCNTTAVLDVLARTKAAQLAANFKSGNYLKRELNGALSAENVQQAKEQLRIYRQAHKLLQHNQACKNLIH